MKPFSVGRIPRGLFLSLALLSTVALSYAQNGKVLADGASITPTCAPVSNEPAQAFPIVELGCGRVVQYLGVYDGSGEFKSVSKFTRKSGKSADLSDFQYVPEQGLRPREVPRFVDLHSRERAVENFMPPARAKSSIKGQSVFSTLRDDLITFVYGREQILVAPHHLTTDSRGRVIISDPVAGVVHVLDGKNSFRILGGQVRRLLTPSGVAVDADNNIYVADSERGLVEVYDPDGRFLRDMGMIAKDEGLFQYPTGIAIDRTNARLYVLDSPRNLLFMLDLQGNVLKRTGNLRADSSGLVLRNHGHPGEAQQDATGTDGLLLNHPTEISIGDGEIVVLDSSGSRIQATDLQCNYLRQFATHAAPATRVGLARDAEGNIYVSDLDSGAVRLYSRNGQPLSLFGRRGSRVGEFSSATALWVDSTDTIFVADTSNHRIQVFQINPSKPR